MYARFPEGAFLSIGMTSDPIRRFTEYRKHWEVYRNHEASPRMKNDEFILFRCWSKEEGFKYEYLLQKHTILEDGEFHSVFGSRMNQQLIRKPSIKSTIKAPHYVYAKVSRVPFTFKFEPSHLPAKTANPSTTHSKTPAQKRNRVISESDEDEVFEPPPKKKIKLIPSKKKSKKTPALVFSSDDDDD